MDRKAAINFARVGAQKLWAGTSAIQPNAKTGAHHHGALESVIYVVRGKARMRWGEQLEYVAEANAGDFIFIPAIRAAPGDQCQHRRAARMRAGAQRQRGRGGQPRHRARRETRSRPLDRSDPQIVGWAAPPPTRTFVRAARGRAEPPTLRSRHCEERSDEGNLDQRLDLPIEIASLRSK